MKTRKPKPFEILDHTADVRLRAIGKTPKDLFRHALEGLFSFVREETHGDGKHPPRAVHRDIVVDGSGGTALLVNFLNEALYFGNVHYEVYRDINIFHLSEKKLEGELRGESVARFDEDVKAVTHHGAAISKNSDGFYEVTFILDI